MFLEGAGPARDQDGWLLHAKRPVQGFIDLFELVGVDGAHVFDAHGAHKRLDVDRFGHLAGNGVAGTGVFLLTGHGGDAVVEHDCDQVAAVIRGIE